MIKNERFPLTYDLNAFQSGVDRHLFLGFFQSAFIYPFLCVLFLVTQGLQCLFSLKWSETQPNLVLFVHLSLSVCLFATEDIRIVSSIFSVFFLHEVRQSRSKKSDEAQFSKKVPTCEEGLKSPKNILKMKFGG